MDLIVVGFQDRYRAAQVLTELRQTGRHVFDLDQAITISWEDRRNFIVQQCVNLSSEDGSRWIHLWGAFIGAILFQPFTDRMVQAASDLSGKRAEEVSTIDREWWVSEVGIPDDFIRDVGALVRPGDSAIVAMSEKFEPQVATAVMRDCGGSLLHTSLSPEQVETIRTAIGNN